MIRSMQELIFRSVQEVHVRDELEAALGGAAPLRIKYGIDPSGNRIHIGHASTIRKLQHFIDAGHQVVLIVGSFTGMIGDASDKQSERNMLDADTVRANMRDYESQLRRIIDMDRVELHYNHEWFEPMELSEWLEINQLFSVAQMIERDNFSERYQRGARIGLQEFQYPLLQGYDSVAVQADVEIGGTDQLFNLMAGRTVQKHYGQAPQHVITYELLQADDGQKMSKSWENCIWVDDTPEDMYGKLMRINDELTMHYFRICTDISDEELAEYERQLENGNNPREVKDAMARAVIAVYHDKSAADRAAQAFTRQFREGKLPQDIPEVAISKTEWQTDSLLVEAGLASSKSAARRLLEQGGVRRNQEPVNANRIQIEDGDVIQAGKRRFARIALQS